MTADSQLDAIGMAARDAAAVYFPVPCGIKILTAAQTCSAPVHGRSNGCPPIRIIRALKFAVISVEWGQAITGVRPHRFIAKANPVSVARVWITVPRAVRTVVAIKPVIAHASVRIARPGKVVDAGAVTRASKFISPSASIDLFLARWASPARRRAVAGLPDFRKGCILSHADKLLQGLIARHATASNLPVRRRIKERTPALTRSAPEYFSTNGSAPVLVILTL